MSRAYSSIFAGFVTLCLGLIAASAVPVGQPTALGLAFGESLSTEQLGMVELGLMAVTVFLSVVFVTDGVIIAIRGRGSTLHESQPADRDDTERVKRSTRR